MERAKKVFVAFRLSLQSERLSGQQSFVARQRDRGTLFSPREKNRAFLLLLYFWRLFLSCFWLSSPPRPACGEAFAEIPLPLFSSLLFPPPLLEPQKVAGGETEGKKRGKDSRRRSNLVLYLRLISAFLPLPPSAAAETKLSEATLSGISLTLF